LKHSAPTGDYEFKHALVRDALYQSLLSEPRQRLHLKIAEELERRGGNRLNEAAEVLALHYGETSQHATGAERASIASDLAVAG
jgi:predicted ATPase